MGRLEDFIWGDGGWGAFARDVLLVVFTMTALGLAVLAVRAGLVG